ncbi:MAG TPA: DUF4331 family protein [Anaerolineae bacterium]|nr:DUF4331 family protein [Anaerolineae bacterium]HOQ98366.1 DUF4331 family protein [Anaerolineae bacterium]
MSHHIDTATSRKDGRLNIGDLYVFADAGHENTILAMTVNPDAGRSSPTAFHPEARYQLKIDSNGDAGEDVSYQFAFTEPTAGGRQRFELRRIEGPVVETATQGALLAEGETDAITPIPGGGRVWMGLAGDPFFVDARAMFQFLGALSEQQVFDVSVFEQGDNAFAGRNVSAIVLELPNTLFGGAEIGVWATTVAVAHGASAQINRFGAPFLTILFLWDSQDQDDYNSGHPVGDKVRFGPAIASTAANVASLAQTAADPAAYGERVADLLLPSVLRYRPGTAASYGFAGRNGRALTDDAMDVAISLLANYPISDHVGPAGDTQQHFPFLPLPYSLVEEKPLLNPDARMSEPAVRSAG